MKVFSDYWLLWLVPVITMGEGQEPKGNDAHNKIMMSYSPYFRAGSRKKPRGEQGFAYPRVTCLVIYQDYLYLEVAKSANI